MKKEDLLAKIKALSNGIDIVLFNPKKNEAGQDADNNSSAGIYENFTIDIMKEDPALDLDERDPNYKPWAYIEIPESYEAAESPTTFTDLVTKAINHKNEPAMASTPDEKVLSYTVDGGAIPTICREGELEDAIKDYLPDPWPQHHEEELTITIHKKFTNREIDDLPDSGGQ